MLPSGSRLLLLRLVLAALPALAIPAAAGAQPGPLFPEPFRVEHHLVQDDGDGSRFVGEPVTDTYGGSWIVSQRPDGSRLIIDLVRRELTEVRTDKGVYWTVSFDRLAELQAQLRAAQGSARTAETRPAGEARPASPAPKLDPAAELTVTEVPAGSDRTAKSTARSSASALEARAGVQRLRVTRRNDPTAAFEVWVDPSLRLTPAALAALSALETGALSGPAHPAHPAGAAKSADPATPSPAEAPGRYLAAARIHAAGAFPIHTLHPAAPAASAGAQALGLVEDIATRLDRLERFPSELAEIPEGLQKVPHPLEAAVRFLEEDAERNAALAGRRTGQKP